METKNKEPQYYIVTVVLRPKGYNKVYLEGFFLPKNDTCPIAKIKEQCWNYIKPRLRLSEYGLDPEAIEKEIKVKSISYDFVVCEDK